MKNNKKHDKSNPYPSHELQRAGAYLSVCGVERINLLSPR